MGLGTVFDAPAAGDFGLTPHEVLRLLEDTPEFKKRLRQVEKATAALSAERQAAGTLKEIKQLGDDARKDREAAAVELTEARVKTAEIKRDVEKQLKKKAETIGARDSVVTAREVEVDGREDAITTREAKVEAAESAVVRAESRLNAALASAQALQKENEEWAARLRAAAKR